VLSGEDVKCQPVTVFYLLKNYNPVDYKIWGVMEEERVYKGVQTGVNNIAHRKNKIIAKLHTHVHNYNIHNTKLVRIIV